MYSDVNSVDEACDWKKIKCMLEGALKESEERIKWANQ